MRKKQEKEKAFSVRMPKEIWAFLKMDAANKETTMNNIIIGCVKKYMEKVDRK